MIFSGAIDSGKWSNSFETSKIMKPILQINMSQHHCNFASVALMFWYVLRILMRFSKR